MERISIFNYEAFYLDFLEGNLSIEDSALLLKFLEDHPELKVVDESLINISIDPTNLDEAFVSSLKKSTEAGDKIDSTTIEQFILADLEGQLTVSQTNELNIFLSANKDFMIVKEQYAATKFKADYSIVFSNKQALKRRSIVLWPYISIAVAASLAWFIFIGFPNNPNGIKKDKTYTARKLYKKQELPTLPITKEQMLFDEIFKKKNSSLDSNNLVVPPQNIENYSIASSKRNDYTWNQLPIRGITKLITNPKNLEVIENNATQPNNAYTLKETEESYAMVGFNEMNNPIAPITNRLGDLVKQEVDFRSAKPSDKKSGGFFIKIGKLEISHRKY